MAIKILETREEGKSTQVLTDFVRYCREHPEERFWQALRNFSGYWYIFAETFENDEGETRVLDSFNWEGKRHDDGKEIKSSS